MDVNCPDCGCEIDPTTGLTCPRCGATVTCSSLSCEDCDGCSGLFEPIERVVRERLRS
ncbi:hypothetical protein [Halococcoides cellulosivorans]|uniref:hypothetical protein n=1 Tax=Halococcoides cellulosivorans TaxID=1679096 RepID=UPI00131EDF05|nr:hypothetical protein [Halococcoides cellulosivorans]